MIFEFSTLYFPESVRLYNGTDRCSGRVEVFHDGQWGKVCNNQWSHEAAEVVCKELNCGAPKHFQEKFNYGDSYLKSVAAQCSSSVTSISQCTLQDYGGTCKGASLSCAGETRNIWQRTHAECKKKIFFPQADITNIFGNKIIISSYYRKSII